MVHVKPKWSHTKKLRDLRHYIQRLKSLMHRETIQLLLFRKILGIYLLVTPPHANNALVAHILSPTYFQNVNDSLGTIRFQCRSLEHSLRIVNSKRPSTNAVLNHMSCLQRAQPVTERVSSQRAQPLTERVTSILGIVKSAQPWEIVKENVRLSQGECRVV